MFRKLIIACIIVHIHQTKESKCDSQLHQNLPLTNIFENSFRRYTNSKKANFIFILKLCKSEIAVKFFAFWYKTLQLLFQLNIVQNL